MRGWAVFIVLLAIPAALAAQAPPDADSVSQGITGGDEGLWGGDFAIGLAIGGTSIAALAGLLYFLGVGGLRHINDDNVLEHPLRRSILESVEENPGVHLRELAQTHETAVTNTQWHLRKLEMAGLVRTQKVSGRRLYYPTQGGIQTRQEALENAATRNPNAEAIFQFISSHGGCNQRSLAEGLDMNPGTVRWHLRRLEDAGLIRCVPEGAQTKYYSAQRPPRPKRVAPQAS